MIKLKHNYKSTIYLYLQAWASVYYHIWYICQSYAITEMEKRHIHRFKTTNTKFIENDRKSHLALKLSPQLILSSRFHLDMSIQHPDNYSKTYSVIKKENLSFLEEKLESDQEAIPLMWYFPLWTASHQFFSFNFIPQPQNLFSTDMKWWYVFRIQGTCLLSGEDRNWIR